MKSTLFYLISNHFVGVILISCSLVLSFMEKGDLFENVVLAAIGLLLMDSKK